MIQRIMTAQEFTACRAELPDAGQWAELVRGVPVTLQPPDLEHGNVVLNLSKAFAAYVQETFIGYPCFDLGVKVEDRPDTIFFPAVSYFVDGERFAEADKEFTENVPSLVIELVSTSERRRCINERVGAYLRRGVSLLWLIDPQQRTVHVVEQGRPAPRRISEFETLRGDPLLSGFQIRVGELFVEPEWAR